MSRPSLVVPLESSISRRAEQNVRLIPSESLCRQFGGDHRSHVDPVDGFSFNIVLEPSDLDTPTANIQVFHAGRNIRVRIQNISSPHEFSPCSIILFMSSMKSPTGEILDVPLAPQLVETWSAPYDTRGYIERVFFTSYPNIESPPVIFAFGSPSASASFPISHTHIQESDSMDLLVRVGYCTGYSKSSAILFLAIISADASTCLLSEAFRTSRRKPPKINEIPSYATLSATEAVREIVCDSLRASYWEHLRYEYKVFATSKEDANTSRNGGYHASDMLDDGPSTTATASYAFEVGRLRTLSSDQRMDEDDPQGRHEPPVDLDCERHYLESRGQLWSSVEDGFLQKSHSLPFPNSSSFQDNHEFRDESMDADDDQTPIETLASVAAAMPPFSDEYQMSPSVSQNHSCSSNPSESQPVASLPPFHSLPISSQALLASTFANQPFENCGSLPLGMQSIYSGSSSGTSVPPSGSHVHQHPSSISALLLSNCLSSGPSVGTGSIGFGFPPTFVPHQNVWSMTSDNPSPVTPCGLDADQYQLLNYFGRGIPYDPNSPVSPLDSLIHNDGMRHR